MTALEVFRVSLTLRERKRDSGGGQTSKRPPKSSGDESYDFLHLGRVMGLGSADEKDEVLVSFRILIFWKIWRRKEDGY